MLQKFKKHLENSFPYLGQSTFYIAVSGGIDSMVLVDLLEKIGYQFGVLHCNFQLRGQESDDDLKFLYDYFTKRDIRFIYTVFETEKYANDEKISIQMAARDLRYNWFSEQKVNLKFDYLFTAHHLDDSLETFIINLSRGSGIKGLMGIPETNDYIIRPLLPFTRTEIVAYAKKYKISWSEDSSNASDKYIRNKIRHYISPLLKELNPDFLEAFAKTQYNLRATFEISEDAIYSFKNAFSEIKSGEIHFDIKGFTQFSNYRSYLYEIFKQYGFTAWNDVFDLVYSQTGKKIVSPKFMILKNRNYLILSRISEHELDKTSKIYKIKENQIQVKIPLKITFSKVNDISQTNTNCIFVDCNTLEYPLIIRKWEEGDSFYPFGMKGKKLISKYFKDQKFSMLDKEKTWLLCSKTEVVWIINHRADDRFKVTKDTLNILKITTE